jgi:GNAT superfamily N-acetyltransferase
MSLKTILYYNITMSRYIKTSNILFGTLSLTGIGASIYGMKYLNSDNEKSVDILCLQDFRKEEHIYDEYIYDEYEKRKAIRYTYYDPETNEEVGYIDFTPHNGQIGFWGVYEKYRHKTLGKQMIEEIKPIIKKNGVNKIYGYTYAEEVKRMSEHNKKIKRVERTGFDYYEVDI